MRLTFTTEIDSLELAVPQSVELNTDDRTISGRILPYGVEAARTSYGKPVKFMPGSLIPPADLSRIKLLIDHNHSRPVGFAVAMDQDDIEARATFSVPAGDAGDSALLEASSKLRDGLSVGVDVRRGRESEDGTAYIIEAAAIQEVSLCAIPAFSDARVTKVTASTHTPEDQPRISITLTNPPEPASARAAMIYAHAADEDPEPASPSTTTEKETPTMDEPTTTDETQTPVPFSQTAPAFTAQAPTNPSAVFDAIAATIRTGGTASDVTAALTDVIPANDAGSGLLPVSMVGEFWQAQAAETPYINFAVTRKNLTNGLKQQGWAWVTRPEVDDYAGNKTAIPSGPVATKLVDADTKRMAGGWDVDRIYLDLADGSMIRELVEAAVVDLANKYNSSARTALLAAATSLGSTSTTLQAVLLEVGQQAVSIGARLDYLAVAPDLWSTLAGLTKDQVPWWLGSGDGVRIGGNAGNIGGVPIFVDPQLPKGQWLAGDRRAATWWQKEPPVRVQAVDIANGGVDVAVFGYYAQVVNEPLAVWTGDVDGVA